MDNSTIAILYFAAIIATFYFVFLRPQQKRQRDAVALLASLGEGDRVMTAAGIIGRIRVLRDETADIEIADGVIVEMAKGAIVRKVEA